MHSTYTHSCLIVLIITLSRSGRPKVTRHDDNKWAIFIFKNAYCTFFIFYFIKYNFSRMSACFCLCMLWPCCSIHVNFFVVNEKKEGFLSMPII